jgi:hypothetical protein
MAAAAHLLAALHVTHRRSYWDQQAWPVDSSGCHQQQQQQVAAHCGAARLHLLVFCLIWRNVHCRPWDLGCTEAEKQSLTACWGVFVAPWLGMIGIVWCCALWYGFCTSLLLLSPQQKLLTSWDTYVVHFVYDKRS